MIVGFLLVVLLIAVVLIGLWVVITSKTNLGFFSATSSYSTTVPPILFGVGIARVAVLLATFLLSQTFLGLFDSFLEFREAFHDLREGIGLVFLTFTIVFCSNGRLSVETLFESSIFLVLMALTGFVGRVRAPMLLA